MPVRTKTKKPTRRIKVDPAQLKSAGEIFHFGPSTLIGVEPLVISARKVTAQLVVKPHHMNRNHRVGGRRGCCGQPSAQSQRRHH